ncbi:HlyD family secretion protein [Desulfovibrio mangrovi]|uniref:HlyD family secretion protein n=1 Tax=Desulfovibrio mangrovi TaxID=2976983 RepID=UPI00224791DF|nr:HlyD family secretion protein [Desulfovibrio mangrovi]UZP67424.1 HlyD family secretion protein [Desulfovibrio mangrovi]
MEAQNKSTDSAQLTPAQAKRKKTIVMLTLLLLLLGSTGYVWAIWGEEETDDAFVDGHIYSVNPRVSGFVNSVLVEDNQQVEAGQLLIELDPTDLEVALAQARADLSTAESQYAALEMQAPLTISETDSRVTQANAQLAGLYKNLEQAAEEEEAARKAVEQATAVEKQAALDMKRYETLIADKVVSQSAYDNALTKLKTAQAELGSAQAKMLALTHKRGSLQQDVDRLKASIRLAKTGHDKARIDDKQALAQKARVELALARVKQAELNLSYTRITAPAAGYVTKRNVEAGQQIAAGQMLLAVVPLDKKGLWITANFKETQLTHMQVGQHVTMKVDAYPDITLSGTVESLMAGTGSAFSLFPPENASGNFVKVVQRVPVKVVLDETNQNLPDLRIGMSVISTVHTR